MKAHTDPWAYTAEDLLKQYHPLNNSHDLNPLLDRIGDSRIVLLGGAFHGAHEFYTWRSAITKRLVAEKGFTLIAVEGEWPDCYRINRFIKGDDSEGDEARVVLSNFNRWPSWMWANWEMAAFVEWLRRYNSPLSIQKKIGLYGMDIYGIHEALESAIDMLKETDPENARNCKEALKTFVPYEEESADKSEIKFVSKSCEGHVFRLLKQITDKRKLYSNDPEAELHSSRIEALITHAETYYKTLMSSDRLESWNIRDKHMMDTLDALLDFHGRFSKLVIWGHSTHLEDGRATPMYRDGMINLGQLLKEKYSAQGVISVGMGSYRGTVAAAKDWGGPVEVTNVPPAKQDSVEDALHRESAENKLLILGNDLIRKHFGRILGQRAIGVVYDPLRDKASYIPTVLASAYDAYLYLDTVSALHPLGVTPDVHQIPETYPFAF